VIEVREFRVDTTDGQIDDVRERLARARFPEAETVDDWSQGVPLAYLRELADYWARDYDMHRVADRLNAHPQYLATIDGLDIHLLHVRSPHPDARPLVMTHGWPGSVLEFANVIEPLTDPAAHGGSAEDAFHLVLPTLPGFGFSAKPTRTGFGVEWIADAWHRLMGRLGYPEYYAQGGDWGAFVAAVLGARRPDGLLGIHVNLALASPDALRQLGEPTAEEQRMLAARERFLKEGTGYSAQQSTRPQTVGYALADSPIGQLAWIVEKFHAWTDCAGHPENAVSRDEILDDVMMYWQTNSAASSARIYWESYGAARLLGEVAAPSAYSLFPKELSQLSERWLRTRFTDLRYYHALERGGHFAALEQPDLFVREVRAGIRALAGDR
jgi:pimeloyl-ACP methyl ester carboxylesterase